MHPSEFSLDLSWSPQVNGVTPATPGFYLCAQYANEGEAVGVVKGSYQGHGSLVNDEFLTALCILMCDYGLLEPNIAGATLGQELAEFSDEAQQRALAYKRAQLDKLRAEVAELEAQIEP